MSACTFCGCGGWNQNANAGACLHEGALATAPRATAKWVCVVCEHQGDDWAVVMKHYYHTGHGFVSTEQRGNSHQENASMKRFKKIRYNERSVVLEYTVHDGTKTEEIAFGCEDAPHADFSAALQALGVDVLNICELDESYGKDMRIQAVSLSLNAKSGARGAVVTAMKALQIANGPLALHTPHLLSETADDDDGDDTGERAGVMPEGMWDRVEALETEAWAYLEGKRAPKQQMDLPLEGAKEPELAGAGV